MAKDHMTREELDSVAMSDSIFSRLTLANTGWSPLTFLEQAGAMKIEADENRERIAKRVARLSKIDPKIVEESQLHNELSSLTLAACDACDKAYEAVLDAAFKFIQTMEEERDKYAAETKAEAEAANG
jgi:hypothetical protein